MLLERAETGTGEAMAKELGLADGKLTLAQATCQTMDTAQLKDVSEMLNMRRYVETKDQNIININKTVKQIT